MSHRAPRTKKGLGELLAELSNPRPDTFDPENEGADGFNAGTRDTDDTNGDDAADFGYERDESARDHYVAVGKGRIRSQLGVQLAADLEEKYKGERVARKTLKAFGSDDEDEDEDEQDVDDDDDDDEEEEEEEEEDDDDQDDDEDDDDDDDDDGEESEEEEEEDDEAKSAQMAAELKKMAAKEKELLKNLASSSNTDVEKGRNVKNQQAIWESLLDLRIQIQNAVTSANTLPTPDAFPAFINPDLVTKSTLTQTSKAISTATTLLTTLISDLLETRAILTTQNETVTLKPSNFASTYLKKRKRSGHDDDNEEDDDKEIEDTDMGDSDSSTQLWSSIESFDSAFDPFRDATIDKWSNKVMASSAANVNQGKKFKAINQSALVQIKSILSDKDRLVKRTRLVRASGVNGGRHLGYVEPPKKEEAADADGEGGKRKKTELEEVEELHEREVNRKNRIAMDSHLSNYDDEVFDDGDFYQQLLKELIEGRLLETDDPTMLSMKWAELKQLQAKTKKKKVVDTKASKGRKIRYAVHEKLQNFMAPEPRGTWHDSMTEELFSSLFGNVVVGKEDADEQQANEEGAWGEVHVPSDGLKLFG
ncbi:hypothetical protein HDU99_002269 [Rhizoclosmatium hyalinum]|nr:hypothetical protein HDU99_002269 [Rhizoclosmatium hyalinum]